jgi:hypothetical protein
LTIELAPDGHYQNSKYANFLGEYWVHPHIDIMVITGNNVIGIVRIIR